MSDFEIKTFGGFLAGAAKLKLRMASSVALYSTARKDCKGDVEARIRSACMAGKIDAEYRDTLLVYLEACHALYLKSGKVIDSRDPRDWNDLGNGGRMRKKHLDSELNF